MKSSDRLLTGSIPRAIVSLAGPMFVSAILQNAQNLIDLFWVGRLGSVAVAALTLSGVMMMAIFPVMMGIATGTVAFVARAFGAGEKRRAAVIAANSLMLGVLVGVALALTIPHYLEPICRALGTEPEVVVEAVRYLRASIYGMAIGMLLFISSSALQASGNTVTPMMAMLGANILNLILDPLFIFGWKPLRVPGFGVAGAAWATVLANFIAAMGMLYVLVNGHSQLRIRLRDLRIDWRLSLGLLKVGLPSMAQMTSRSLMGVVLFRVIAKFGTAVVAGYGIGMRWHQVMLMPCFVLGNAAATMVGQNLGAENPARAKRAALTSVAMIVSLMFVVVIVLFMLAGPAVALFNSSADVIEVGRGFLRRVTPFYILIGASIVFDRSLNGAGCTVATMVFTILTLWGVQVPLAIYWSKHWFDPAYHGVWRAMNVASTISFCLSTFWFMRGRWVQRRLD